MKPTVNMIYVALIWCWCSWRSIQWVHGSFERISKPSRSQWTPPMVVWLGLHGLSSLWQEPMKWAVSINCHFFQNAFFVWEDWESSGHYFGFGSCVCVVFFFLRLDELGRFYTSQYRSLGSWTGRLSFVVIVPIISCWNSADIVTNDLISCPPLWGLFLHYSSPWNGLLPKKRIVSEQNLLENFVHWGLLFESFSIA